MTSRLERLYHRLPQPMQDLALTAKSLKLTRERYGGDFAEILAEYENRSTWGEAETAAYQLAMLQATCRHAAQTVPHYSGSQYRDLADIASLDDLASFPILTSTEVRELGHRLHSTADLGPLQIVHTSGTTARPLELPVTLRADREKWAVWWRYRGWHGIDRREWSASFGSKNIALSGGRTWRVDHGQRRVLFSSYHTTPAALDEVIEVMSKRGLRWIHGFPAVIALTAERVIERGLQGQFAVRWVTFGGDTVLDHHRSVIFEAFGVIPRQHYGAAEMAANISECTHGALHVDEDYSLVEVADGQLIGTVMTNPAFPLVRYQIGDTATVTDEGCTCGLPGRIIASIDGRTNDYLVMADGSKLGRFGAVAGLQGISSAQFIQRKPGHADMYVTSGRRLSDSELAAARRQIEDNTPGGLKVVVLQVDALTRTKGGKVRMVIQEDQPTTS